MSMNIFKKILVSFCIIVFSVSCFIGCGQSKKDEPKTGLKITTSFYPVYIATLNVTQGVNGVSVTNMTKPQTGCLHDYQLTTEDMKKLEKTDILVINGAGMESFIEKAVKQQKNMKIIDSSQGIKLLKDEKENNPHYWLSISKEIEQINNIADQLSKLDPANKDKYKSNASEYINKLNKLSNEAKKALNELKNREIVTFHEAFPYFADEFNLKIAAVVEREPGSEPTPKELEDVINIVRYLPVKVLFTEPQYSTAAADLIAKETGAKIYQLDPVVTGKADESAKDMYIITMKKNIQVLKEALNQ